MTKKKEKGFTLIELIAVLVIMAIIALIATPLVMNIIRKARVAADKRSIDAYGRSIELAVASYLLDNGKFPTDISQLTVEYNGNEVVCETTQLNPDSSVYLTGCTVAGRSVDYAYGTDKIPTYEAYSVGDLLTYNNVNYYVIKNSGAKEENVILLKEEPLSVEEVNLYGGVGTANNHVNNYIINPQTSSYYYEAIDISGYGGMAYYTSENCRYENNQWILSECITDYAKSDVKYVVDAWAAHNVPSGLVEARLITLDELTSNLHFEYYEQDSSSGYRKTEDTPSWVYNSNYWYWTMTESNHPNMWNITTGGWLQQCYVGNFVRNYVVRPVIVLPKSELN